MLRELAVAATILLAVADPPAASPDTRFRVIVHAGTTVSSLKRSEVSSLFLRKTRSWPDGTEVRPVEPPARSAVREEFARAIHGKSLAYVTRYWHRLIFAGRAVPPAELRSDEAVLEFVRNRPGAIGYIGPDTPPGNGVKVVAVTP